MSFSDRPYGLTVMAMICDHWWHLTVSDIPWHPEAFEGNR